MPKTTIKTTIEKLPHSMQELKGEIPAADIAEHRAKALRRIGKEAELPGFRKGHVPEAELVKRLGEIAIIEEAAEIILDEQFAEMLTEHKAQPIGRPSVALTKVTAGSPVSFSIKFAIVPEVKLGDYKKIAKEELAKKPEPLEVTEKDIDEVIQHIRETEAHRAAPHEHTHDAEGGHSHDLPEWTDEFVKGLGDFKDIADFREKAKGNILKEKKIRAESKRRGEMIAALVKATPIEVPDILVESELMKMRGQFQDDLARVGLKMDDYLKHIKKSEEDITKEWRPDAENRAKTQLLLNKIALEENLMPTEEEKAREAKHLMEAYKDANPENVMVYVETMLANEKVLKFLEGQK